MILTNCRNYCVHYSFLQKSAVCLIYTTTVYNTLQICNRPLNRYIHTKLFIVVKMQPSADVSIGLLVKQVMVFVQWILAIKLNEPLTYTMTQPNVEENMLLEGSKAPKTTYCMLFFIDHVYSELQNKIEACVRFGVGKIRGCC